MIIIEGGTYRFLAGANVALFFLTAATGLVDAMVVELIYSIYSTTERSGYTGDCCVLYWFPLIPFINKFLDRALEEKT